MREHSQSGAGKLPTFEEWVTNAFTGTPWNREELFCPYAERPSDSPYIEHWSKYFSPDASILAGYLARLFENPEFLETEYSSEQLDNGFSFIFGIESEYCRVAREPEVPVDVQMRWVLAIKTLYTRLFTRVCSPHLSHLDEYGSAPVNGAVYMLWDMDCLEGAAMFPEHNKGVLVEPVFDVLTHALSLSHPACQESALHGLSHLHWVHGDRVERIVSEYLEQGRAARPELIDYARAARTGGVM